MSRIVCGRIKPGLGELDTIKVEGDLEVQGSIHTTDGGWFTRQINVVTDTTGKSFSTTWVMTHQFNDVLSNCLPGSKIKMHYHVPVRNDSTSWGGCYLEPQLSFDGGVTWQSLGGAGYDVIMEMGQSIHSANYDFFIDPGMVAAFNVSMRLYAKSYDGTTTMITSNAINSVSGTASVMSGVNGTQHYVKVIMEEIAQ